MPVSVLHEPILRWYGANARDLPWRGPDVSAWEVLVSEVMLQQTPVSRVVPAYRAWIARWPIPAKLAAEPVGEAVRQWGRLGYPRRALRLHGAATAIVSEHGGAVPRSYAALLELPGVGSYTAAAVASFAFGQRHAVLDTNVRRVFARAIGGQQYPATATTAAERDTAEALLPDEAETAARWAVAVMEVGALVCRSRNPDCASCPIVNHCAWQLGGRPPHTGPARRGQSYAGTDRQCRGALLQTLRTADRPVPRVELAACWAEHSQRERALDGLVADGLVQPLHGDRFRLPS